MGNNCCQDATQRTRRMGDPKRKLRHHKKKRDGPNKDSDKSIPMELYISNDEGDSDDSVEYIRCAIPKAMNKLRISKIEFEGEAPFKKHSSDRRYSKDVYRFPRKVETPSPGIEFMNNMVAKDIVTTDGTKDSTKYNSGRCISNAQTLKALINKE